MIFLLGIGPVAQGLEVKEVVFKGQTPPGFEDEWIEVAIRLEMARGFADRVDDRAQTVTVNLGAAWAVGRGRPASYRFFQAQATLVALPADDPVTVFFYLPPEIVARDGLRAEPFAWRIVLSLDGQALPTQPRGVAERLRDPTVAQSFAARLAAEAPRNAGILQPIYLTPFFVADAGKTRDLPSFVRPELSARPGGRP